MSLIERAALRLEELRLAGIEVQSNNVKREGNAGSENAPIRNAASKNGEPTKAQAISSHQNANRPWHADVALDFARLAKLGFVTPDIPRSRIADEFRILKRPLIANASPNRATAVHHSNLIMVTSSVPGEGKTFSAVNLAMSLATELDRTVLLVDADVARPSLPSLLELPTSKGLLDVLEDKTLELSRVLLRTNVEKLSILPSGTPHSHATELLASDGMASLLQEVSARYSDRIIIFDSPPLLVTTEARVLATQMGQIVFVIHAESTLQSDVKRALATIESCPIKLMVLNQARAVDRDAGGYGYGYGYGR